MEQIIGLLAQEFHVKPEHAQAVVELLDQGNTVPFIARYRKERHGAMDDQAIRELADRLAYLRGLEQRRGEVREAIQEQGKLTPELAAALERAATLAEVEDLYRPYRPKRRTRAGVAREKGLEPLAQLLLAGKDAQGRPLRQSPLELAAPYVSPEKGVETREEALQAPATFWPRASPMMPPSESGCGPCSRKTACCARWPPRRRTLSTACTTTSPSRCAACKATGCWPSTGGRRRASSRWHSSLGRRAPCPHPPGRAAPPPLLAAAGAGGPGRLVPAAVPLFGAGNPRRLDRHGRRAGHPHLRPEPAPLADAAPGEEPGGAGLRPPPTAPAASWLWWTPPARCWTPPSSTPTNAPQQGGGVQENPAPPVRCPRRHLRPPLATATASRESELFVAES